MVVTQNNQVATKAMSYYLNSENHLDPGPIYVRENGQLHMVNLALDGVRSSLQKPRPFRLFPKGFSVELCMNREDDTAQKEKTDHFIFTYTREGNLRYSAKSLFSLVLGFISDNVDHIDSLIGFPEQIAEKLFSAAEARQKFTEPGAGLRALQKFTEAYGSLVLCSLCLRNRYLVISEKLEEIKSFRELTCLDLSCCKLGDEHELLEHLTNEALSSVTQLHLKDNCLSDAGVRKMTAPVRVMKRGLENLTLLDLSCNPEITDAGIGYLFSFRKLNCLDISGTGLKDIKAVKHKLQTHIGLVHSKVPLKEFDHSNCKTEGWADQWERVTSEAVKPRETGEPRTAAQHFYEKTECQRVSCPRPLIQEMADLGFESKSGTLPYGKRTRAEAPVKCPLADTHGNSSEKLQFYKEKAPDCHGPLLKREAVSSQESKKSKKRAFEEPEKEQSNSSQSSKQKYVCLAVEDWDLLNSY
uniref:leucine-rich repeat-containing protein 42 isoform X2 n=1 Tax=Halichoerus grypus TaxID=9711 RepID=UPI001659DB5F|nr:leucine-rich repeat-containing protein 42 isoform X2 [Halichoerus grypus]